MFRECADPFNHNCPLVPLLAGGLAERLVISTTDTDTPK
jgi:hypothetical protein